MKRTTIIIQPGGPRPPYCSVARHLWGNVDFDSDGDSFPPDSADWNELTLVNRQDTSLRVDVDPVSYNPLQLKIVSESADLAIAVADFFVRETKGKVITGDTEHSSGADA